MFSLAATVRQARPDLLTTMKIEAEPIPDFDPAVYIKETNIEDIGEPSRARFLTQADAPSEW